MKGRTFLPEIYEDDGFLSLSCRAQTVAIYCMTGPVIHHLPIYRVSVLTIQGKFHLSDEAAWADVCAELEGFGISFQQGHCIIDQKALAYVSFSQSISGKNDRSVLHEVQRLPASLQERLLQIPGLDEKLGRAMADYVEGSIQPRTYAPSGVAAPEVAAETGGHETSVSAPATPAPQASLSYLDQLPSQEAAKLAERYGITPERVQAAATQAADWCRAKGKRQKDYAAFLRNWLSKAAPRESVEQIVDLGEPLAVEAAPNNGYL